MSHNSPGWIEFGSGNLFKNIVEAIAGMIDAIASMPIRVKEGMLRNEALKIDNKIKDQQAQMAKQTQEQEAKEAANDRDQMRQIAASKAALDQERVLIKLEGERLALEKQKLDLVNAQYSIASVIATNHINLSYPNADLATKSMLIQSIMPQILQLSQNGWVALTLPQTKPETENDDSKP
jgi:hypothetical protein